VRLLAPLRERSFNYRRYEALLARLADGPYHVVCLRELPEADADDPIVGIRHDVDHDLGSALHMARLERARGIRTTYFVRHTAAYYTRDARLRAALRTLQDDLGHEVGLHHDVLTLMLRRGADPVAELRRELEWLRDAGIDVRGAAAHGAGGGYHNNWVFSDWPEAELGVANADELLIDGRAARIPKTTLAEVGLEYEAYHLDEDVYVSDARFDARRRRVDPASLELETLQPGTRTVLLVHPCHWHASVPARYAALARRLASRSS
jgi:hypothetical protein